MPSTNTDPTIEEIKNIEIAFNALIDTEYETADARYPDIDLDEIDITDGANFLGRVHETTGEPMFQVRNNSLMPAEIPRDMLNALRKVSCKINTLDAEIHHNCRWKIDSQKVVSALSWTIQNLEDSIGRDGETTIPGIATLLKAGRVHIITEDDGTKRLSIIEE
tara:strand:+ start:287 stop:778 length:492 start_codon:yes stop_codon:yes gene_type:complete